jgi:hypothetical protein
MKHINFVCRLSVGYILVLPATLIFCILGSLIFFLFDWQFVKEEMFKVVATPSEINDFAKEAYK